MKLDILLPTGRKGGVENMVRLLSRHLIGHGWEVRVVQLVWAKDVWLEQDIPFFPLLEGKGTYQLDHLRDAYQGFLGAHGHPDVILATNWPYASYVAKAAAHVEKMPVVVSWLHAPLGKYKEGGLGDETALAYADYHLAISQEIYRDLVTFFGRKVARVNNAVTFPKEIVFHEKNEKRKLFYIGRFEKEKRMDLMIRAMGNDEVKKNWELFIIGRGESEWEDQQPRLFAKEYCAEDAIRWLGWKEDPWKEAKDADAIIMSSDYEGSSLVVIEALCRGIPLITTPVGLAPEIIRPGKNGFLFPCGDADALIEILLAMVNGILPEIRPQDCRESVRDFEEETALTKIEEEIIRFSKGEQN